MISGPLAIVSDNELDIDRGTVLVRSPGADLAQIVGIMTNNERVAGVIAAGAFQPRPGEDILVRMVAPGAQIHARSIRDHDDKMRCLSVIAELLEAVHTSRDRRQPIQQCVDELVMNALYDAPIDARGRRLFADVAVRDRIRMRTDRTVAVRFAHDGKTFAIAVRDCFGTIDRATVLRFLDKALSSAEAVDRSTSGAGLGLYLVATATTILYITVTPKIATEVVCSFELGRAARLEQFGIFTLPPSGNPASPTARQILVRRRHPWLFRLALACIAVIVIGGGFVAWYRFLGPGRPVRVAIGTEPGAAVEIDGRPAGVATNGTLDLTDLRASEGYRVVVRLDGFETTRELVHPQPGSNDLAMPLRAVARVDIDTDPAGATVTIDGKAMGTTPLALTSLAPGASVTVAFAHPGYRTATERVVVPAPGQRSHVARKLETSADLIRVRFVSTPPGAAIVRTGDRAGADRTYTPADVYVPVGETQRFTLVMPGYKTLVIEPFVASTGEALEKGGALVAE